MQTEQVLKSGRVDVAELSLCRSLDYRIGCSRRGSAQAPAHLSPLRQSNVTDTQKIKRRRVPGRQEDTADQIMFEGQM